MVSPFEVREDGVVWRGDGETLSVQAWGDNSLRTRSMVMGDIEDSDFSLLPPRRSAVEVSVELGSAQEGERLGAGDSVVTDVATVTNGRITAVLTAETEYVESLEYVVHRCRLEYRNQNGRGQGFQLVSPREREVFMQALQQQVNRATGHTSG